MRAPSRNDRAMTSRDTPIVDQIRDLIFSGQILPGEQLLEIQTAERLGISRTPLRPALAALAQEGLLQPRGRRGYIVRKVSLKDMTDAFLVRANLEGLAASIVAQRGLSEQERAELERTLRHGDDLLAVPEKPDFQQEFRAMNDHFHNLLLEASRNECLQDLSRRALMLPLLSSRVVHFDDQDALRRSHFEHWIVLRAILGREAERARSVMCEHILRSCDILYERMVSARAGSAPESRDDPDRA
jgi:GntR family transcriptional regulator of vanillate catabolism